MITHIVMWKFKDQAEGASKAQNLVRAKALLDAYQNHPQHQALKPFIGAARLERQCMDYEN